MYVLSTKYNAAGFQVASITWYVMSIQPSSVMHWKMVRHAMGKWSNEVIPKFGLTPVI